MIYKCYLKIQKTTFEKETLFSREVYCSRLCFNIEIMSGMHVIRF